MLIVMLLVLLTAEEPVVRGRLCVETQCTDTTGRVSAVTPGDRARRFVWTSADAATVQVGIVAPHAEQVDLDAGERARLELTVAGSRGWPLDVQAEVRGRAQWQWTMSAPHKLRRLIVPRGRYAIALRAGHHRAFSRIVEAEKEKIEVGALRLVPLPQVRGAVVDPEGRAIGGALVALPDATVCTVADALGAFVCELGERDMPAALVVSAGGFAERDVPLAHPVETDVDLGRIELPSGYTVAVKVVRPADGPATVTLFRQNKGRDSTKLKTHELKVREEHVKFDAGTGEYALLVSGSGALEKLEVPVAVRDADVSETVVVEPYRIDGTVRLGDEPLAAGTVELRPRESTWDGVLDVRNGTFEGTLWQSHRLNAYVANRDLALFAWIETPRLGDDPTRWDIRIPGRSLSGRVFDAETKKAAAGAELNVHLRSPRGTRDSRRKLPEDGSYRVIATQAGTYTLHVTSPGHVPAKVEVVVSEEDGSRRVDIPLDRGSELTLEVVSQSGQPLPSARVVELVERGGTRSQDVVSADQAGRAVLRGQPGETRVLYVLAHPASFAGLRVSVPAGASPPLRIVVPDATGALRVRATHADGEGPAHFLVRYNGMFLPGSLLGFLAGGYERLASGDVVLPRLPAGVYEVWGLTDPFEEAKVIAANGKLRPPVRVGVSAGEAMVHVVAPPRPGRE